MRRNVDVSPLLSEPVGEDFSFPGLMLADELHLAVTEGVGNSIAVTVAFDDEGETSIDPVSDIRTNKLDMKEAQIVATGDALLNKLKTNYLELTQAAEKQKVTSAEQASQEGSGA